MPRFSDSRNGPTRKATSYGSGRGPSTGSPSRVTSAPCSGVRCQVRPRRWSRQASSGSDGSGSRTSQKAALPTRADIQGISTMRIGPASWSWIWRQVDSAIVESTPP
ncbi:MAG: hypothetical protein BGO49_04105 [Planctomycetales bacterium 71-10]|nr:MAG: hypothetical protein BGO49_04105 [Planctomycetales bacterium 71-10]